MIECPTVDGQNLANQCDILCMHNFTPHYWQKGSNSPIIFIERTLKECTISDQSNGGTYFDSSEIILEFSGFNSLLI